MTLYARFRAQEVARERLTDLFRQIYTGAPTGETFSVAASWLQLPKRIRRSLLAVSLEKGTR